MKKVLVIAVIATAGLMVALPAGAQPPGGGDYGRGDRGDRGDRGGRGFGDPSQFFDRLSGGKNVIIIDQLDERMKGMAQRMAAGAGITNGQITREQFNAAMEAFRAQRGMGRGGFGGPPGGGGPGGNPTGSESQGGQGGPGRGGQMTPEQIDRMAEDNFRKHDKNSTGQLEFDEMPDNLKSNLAKYDTNKDGIISLDEYKPYFRDRMETRNAERGQNATEGGPAANSDALPPAPESAPAQEDERKATVYRTGKMPKDLPAWFADMDVDKDGQVGLWEWVRVRGSGSESIELFRTMDRNDDGLLTVDEVLSYARLNTKSPGDAAVASIVTGDDRSRGAAVAEVTITGSGQDGVRRFRGGQGGWGGGPPSWGNGPGGTGDGTNGMQGPRRGWGGGPGSGPGGGFDRKSRGGEGRDNSGGDGSRKGRGRGGFDRGGPGDATRDNPTDGSKDKNRP
jgi:Ca2+-binding EF-hand superfamily protein